MAKTVAQRDLRDDNAKVVNAAAAEEMFVVTRNGEPVAELRPLRLLVARTSQAAKSPRWRARRCALTIMRSTPTSASWSIRASEPTSGSWTPGSSSTGTTRMLLTRFPSPFDDAVVRSHVLVVAAVVRGGRMRRSRFAYKLIAATTRTIRLDLYSRNAADFSRLENLIRVVAV